MDNISRRKAGIDVGVDWRFFLSPWHKSEQKQKAERTKTGFDVCKG